MTQKLPSFFVNYDEHPAFAEYRHPADNHTAPFEEWFREIDAAVKNIREIADPFSPAYAENYFAAFIDPLARQILQAALTHVTDRGWFSQLLPKILSDFRAHLLNETLYVNEKKTSTYVSLVNPESRKVASELAEQGVSVCKVPEEFTQQIFNHLAPWKNELLAKRNSNPGQLTGISVPTSGPHWELTVELLRATGIFDAVTLFSELPLKPFYFSFGLSHDQENWFKGCYEDVGLPTSKLSYLHFDHDYDVVKAIIYFNNVGIESGPFHVIPGSQSLIASDSQMVFFKYIDQNVNRTVSEKKLASVDYYRPLFKHRQFREEFMRLPRGLRGTSHFGDDVLDNSPMSNFLLSQEAVVTSDVGNCFVFSGGRTLHRGGWVRQGERWSVQVGFRK